MGVAACGGGSGASGAATIPTTQSSPAPSPTTTPTPSPVPSPTGSQASTGLIIPLYEDPPDSDWDHVIAQKQLHPRVPVIIIANPNNGPGSSSDPNYASYIAKAQAAGIIVLGYAYTSIGTRATASVEADMNSYHTWYSVNGMFLDEMSTTSQSYYQTLTAYAHANGMPLVIGNPGADAPANAGTDGITYFEQAGYPTVAFLSDPAHLAVPKSTWSYMAGAVSFDSTTILSTLPYVGYLYMTDHAEPECYCTLPSYYDQLVVLLDR